MEKEGLEITRRRLPHWRLEGSVYFITFRLLRGILSPDEREFARDHIIGGAPAYYQLLAVVVMPDHVHILLRPAEGIDLSRVTKGIKGASARVINRARGTRGSLWQDESWDRLVRDEEELRADLRYIFENPARAGLVSWDDPSLYPGWYAG